MWNHMSCSSPVHQFYVLIKNGCQLVYWSFRTFFYEVSTSYIRCYFSQLQWRSIILLFLGLMLECGCQMIKKKIFRKWITFLFLCLQLSILSAYIKCSEQVYWTCESIHEWIFFSSFDSQLPLTYSCLTMGCCLGCWSLHMPISLVAWQKSKDFCFNYFCILYNTFTIYDT